MSENLQASPIVRKTYKTYYSDGFITDTNGFIKIDHAFYSVAHLTSIRTLRLVPNYWGILSFAFIIGMIFGFLIGLLIALILNMYYSSSIVAMIFGIILGIIFAVVSFMRAKTRFVVQLHFSSGETDSFHGQDEQEVSELAKFICKAMVENQL